MNVRLSYARALATLLFSMLFSLLALSANAKGPTLKFTSLVTAVTQTDQESGTVDVSIHGLELPILVNEDTEIEYLGEEVGITGISAGDLVKIQTFFSNEGVTAEEINILQTSFQQFRLRGEITALDSTGEATFITVAGVEIRADVSTVVVPRNDSDVATLAGLQAGDEISVNGRLENGILQARQIHSGDRDHGEIEFDGILLGISATSATIQLLDGPMLDVTLGDNSSLRGNPQAGDFVEFEGQISATLNLIAHKIAADRDGDEDADDDIPDDDSGTNDVVLGLEIALQAVNSSLSGKAETRYRDRFGVIDQKFEVEVEDSAAGVTYSILVYFEGQAVEFGSLITNQFGEASAEYEIDDNVTEIDLAPLLPNGFTVLDIESVEVLRDGFLVLAGSFGSQANSGAQTPTQDSDNKNDDVNNNSEDNSTAEPGNDDGSNNDGESDTQSDIPAEYEATAILNSTGSGTHGEADIRVRNSEGVVDQKFQVEIEDAPAATTYSILVFFGADPVDFGVLVTNSSGEAEAEFEVDDTISDRSLAPLLPDGKTVLDITSVQLLQGGETVAQGSF